MTITNTRLTALITALNMAFDKWHDRGDDIFISIEKAHSMLFYNHKGKTIPVKLNVRWDAYNIKSPEELSEYSKYLTKATHIVQTINDMHITLDTKYEDPVNEYYEAEESEQAFALYSTYLAVMKNAVEQNIIEWVLTNVICDQYRDI